MLTFPISDEKAYIDHFRVCPHKQTQCQYCKEFPIANNKIQIHYEYTCPKYPIECPSCFMQYCRNYGHDCLKDMGRLIDDLALRLRQQQREIE